MNKTNVLLPGLLLGLAVATPTTTLAGPLDEPQAVSVPSQSLGDALRLLAKQANLQILFAPGLVEGRVAPAVSGTLPPRQALGQLLAGTRIVAEEQGPGVVVVREAKAAPEQPAVAPRPTAAVPVAAATPRAESDDITEVLVTAQRRSERLQDVPISLTVYNQATMDAQGTRNIDDVSRLTPGVQFTRSANNNNAESSDIAIRGISSNAGASTTGVYIDDTPIHGRKLSFPSFNSYPVLFDVERVEVLRGPQGTLFGAGSQGGTVRFISPEPSLTTKSVYARSEFATTQDGDPLYEIGVAGGGPLVDGSVGLRASVSYRHEGGWVDRVDWRNNRMAEENANSNSTVTARVALKWAVNDALTITPSLFYQKRKVDDTAAWWSPRAGEPDATNGQFAGKNRSGNAVASPNDDKFILPALKVEWDLGNGIQLVSSTSYFKREQAATTDYTQFDRAIFLGDPLLSAAGLPAGGGPGAGFWEDNQENFTQEIRLQSSNPDARVSWTAGLFFQRAEEITSHRVFDPSLLDLFGLPGFGDGFIYVESPRSGLDRQVALFGQADVKVTDKLKVTLGLRYAEAEFKGAAFYPETLVAGAEFQSRGSQKERPVTPRLGVNYQLDDNNLLYFTAAKGFRIGGVNAKVGQFCYGEGGSLDQIGLADVPDGFDADSLWSYEVGSKNAFADGRVLLNASAYLIKWKNIQQNVGLGCGFQFTSNLGEAESKGFDLQAVVRVSEHVSLGGTVGFTDARFTKTVQLQPTVASIVREGDHLVASPWTAAVFGQFSFPAFGKDAYIRADYQYGAQQTDRTPATNPQNGNYSLWFENVPTTKFASLRAGLNWNGLDVSVFAQNLFNEQPRLTATQDIALPTGGTPMFYVVSYRPRTIGLTATWRY